MKRRKRKKMDPAAKVKAKRRKARRSQFLAQEDQDRVQVKKTKQIKQKTHRTRGCDKSHCAMFIVVDEIWPFPLLQKMLARRNIQKMTMKRRGKMEITYLQVRKNERQSSSFDSLVLFLYNTVLPITVS